MITNKVKKLILRRPDDCHIHLRDGKLLKTILPYTSSIYSRAIVMPNLVPPIRNISTAISYKKRIIQAIPKNHVFTPLMTCYLTDSISLSEIENGFFSGLFIGAKLYPFNSTTNSYYGIKNISSITLLLERMQKIGMPLLIHGELIDVNIDIFDREAFFIEKVLEPMRNMFPELKIIMEHITTKESVDYINEANNKIAATITLHHLMFNRNSMLLNGIHPHLYCLPILKRSLHQDALRKAIISGSSRFFLGTDSAPHLKTLKESSCGCAGIFNTLVSLPAYASVFEELNALQYFEAFCSENGAKFYGLPFNKGTITLVRKPWKIKKNIKIFNNAIVPFLAGKTLNWRIKT